MANKQILSVVAATILAASFTFTGCGSSSSSSNSSSAGTVSSGAAVSSDGGSTSSDAITEPISVTAFKLLEAKVTKGGTESAIIDGTMYEFPEGTTGILASLGGAYDSNGDNNATSEDANAPALAALATFSNVHGLSTLEAQGVSIDDINNFYEIALTTTDIAIDPLDVPVYAANAKAVLRLSGYPGDGQATSSTAPTSSEAASSSEDSSNPYPGATLRSPFPVQPSSAAETSSEAAASSSSEAASGGTAYADIDACVDAACIDTVTGAELINLNDAYGTPSSSSDAGTTSSDMQTSSEAASSSEDSSNPYPAPAL
ncbi:MAG: hypothetical protein U9N34_08245 [Candidatus Cloacimonadota bacterium]|nr:hypothetical protein [Candidatus Cloacimonadota bacterium]